MKKKKKEKKNQKTRARSQCKCSKFSPGCRCVAAGVRPKTTARERCDGALSDVIPPAPSLWGIAGTVNPIFEFGSRLLETSPRDASPSNQV